jgi:ribosomal protein S18 acetylase RimI-like enzyme
MTAGPTSRAAQPAGAVEVQPVRGRADLKEFIRLPFRIYADDPAWVPPLDAEVRKALSPAHPFHRHAEVACFLARRGGRTVGRIAAIHNRAHVEFHQESVGFFGLFECEDDEAAAAALLATVERWLVERGLNACRGPFNLSTNDELWSPGILIRGFQHPPVVMMGHARDWYARLVERAGYAKNKDLIAIWTDSRDNDLDRLGRSVDRVQRRTGVTMRAIDMKNLPAEIARILEVYNAAWERNWGFVPMTAAEIEHMAKALKPIVNPELCLILEKDGQPIGFGLGLPDYNQVLRHMGGRLFPLGWLKFLYYRRRIDATRVLTLGLKPEYRGRGLDAMVYLEMFRAGERAGAGKGECSWMLEDNLEMLHLVERIGADVYKTYRIFEKPLVD